jgi:hypothetical protein
MKPITRKLVRPVALGVLASLVALSGNLARAQFASSFGQPTTPMAQRNAMNLVVNQINWFQNATRTASSQPNNGYGMLSQQFQAVRNQYAGFKSTLAPQNWNNGANQLAELDAGLDIIQEAFTDYQTGVANGQSTYTALANMCRVLNEAMGVWAQEFKADCRQMRVGW